MIKALFKFDKNIPKDAIVVDTTSNSGNWSGLSPFILSAPPAKRFENLWQFSKVYKKYIMPIDGYPDASWYKWRDAGYADFVVVRYPMGKGTIPEYTYWNDEKLSYIEARKKLYIPEYMKNVIKTDSFHKLQILYEGLNDEGKDLILLDYDAYDHKSHGMTLREVVNNPNKKCGHSFVLLSLLTGELLL